MPFSKQKNNTAPPSVTPLLKSYKESELEKDEQSALRAQYNIEDKETYIVEKKNYTLQFLQFVINNIASVFRVILNVFIIILAIIGLASLTYPNIRKEVIVTFATILLELRTYFDLNP